MDWMRLSSRIVFYYIEASVCLRLRDLETLAGSAASGNFRLLVAGVFPTTMRPTTTPVLARDIVWRAISTHTGLYLFILLLIHQKNHLD
jgi:hypothetical protein